MNFPQLVPTGRSYTGGDFPVKVYKAQDGAEVRILYGDKRTGMTLQLLYQNLADADAALFFAHYQSVQGTYQPFLLGDGTGTAAKEGWTGGGEYIGATYWGSQWRYTQSPLLTSVGPGRSSVTVNLTATIMV